jgi:hypothetical protein
MSDDRRRTEQYASLRDERLRPWMAGAVYPYSAPLREAMRRAGLGQTSVKGADDLRRLPLLELADLGDGRAFVLRPTAVSVAAYGPLADRAALRIADAFGRRPELARQRIDPEHKPVLWTSVPTVAGSLLAASTTTDLDQLTALGRRAITTSGIGEDDRVVVLGAAGPGVGPWQLAAGCRDAGVQLLHAGTEDHHAVVRSAQPTVVAGRGADLARLAETGFPESVRLLVRHDGPRLDADQREALAAAGLPLAEWWAPAGVRAAWVRCPGGVGYHTWPTHELLEVLDEQGHRVTEGRLVWSAVGWHGSVWLRVAIGARGRVHAEPCAACGRTTPRVQPVARPAWAEELDRAPAVAGWLGVRRADGSLLALVTPSADAGDGLRDALAAGLGVRVVPVGASRLARARALVGGVDIADEHVVAPALSRAGS